MKNIISIFICLLLLSCDVTENNDENYQSNIVIQPDLSESEFREAIIGHWENKFEISGFKNVQTLDISRKGYANAVVVSTDSTTEVYSGNYIVNFLEPPAEGIVTRTDLIIQDDDGDFTLSYLNFGTHNAFSPSEGYFLRIDSEPYGAMKRRE